jgi:serine/threonine protein kinase
MNEALAMVPGARLGGYQLVGELGRGAIGEAFAARVLEGPRVGELVCLKILGRQYHAPDAAMRDVAVKSLHHEARVIRQLDHPNIARLIDFGTLAGNGGDVWYLALELVQGANLRELMSRGPLGAFHVMHVGFQVSKALAWAHDQDVVHRDVKPSNVLVGNGGEVKLVDFGLAKLNAASSEYTAHVGTPRYFAPEQLTSEPLTPATDVYALGLVLFEALVGAHPFLVPDELEFRRNVLDGRPVKSLRDRGFPEDLVTIVERCIATKPEERFANGAALARAFAQAIDSHSLATTLFAGAEPLQRGEEALEVDPLSEQVVHDSRAMTRLASLADRVGDVRDEPGDFSSAEQRTTTALEARELAAKAAEMMRYDESVVTQDLSRMARLAQARRSDSTHASTPSMSGSRPVQEPTTPGRRRHVAPEPRSAENLAQRRTVHATEFRAIPNLGQPVVEPPAEVAVLVEEEKSEKRPQPATRAWTRVIVIAGVLLVVLAAIALVRECSSSPQEGLRPALPVSAAAALVAVPERHAPGHATKEAAPSVAPTAPAMLPDPPVPDPESAPRTVTVPKPVRRPEPGPRIAVTIGLLPYGDVTVDGQSLGHAPVTAQLKAGPHRVLARAGRAQRSQTIVVGPEAKTFVIRVSEDHAP